MIGILGGTFDPPHNGHVALAEAALRELGLEELVVLLVANPGHRSCNEDPQTARGGGVRRHASHPDRA